MNLSQFIRYRTCCPLCHSEVQPAFLSNNRKLIVQPDNWLSSKLDNYTSINRNNYKISVWFHQLSHQFFVEHHHNNSAIPENKLPIKLVSNCNKLYNSISTYKFFNSCYFCKKYQSSSIPVDFNFKLKTFSNPHLYEEILWFKHQVDNQYVVIKLINDYSKNYSKIYYSKYPDETMPSWEFNSSTRLIKTKLINIQDNISDKLSKIIIFS